MVLELAGGLDPQELVQRAVQQQVVEPVQHGQRRQAHVVVRQRRVEQLLLQAARLGKLVLGRKALMAVCLTYLAALGGAEYISQFVNGAGGILFFLGILEFL